MHVVELIERKRNGEELPAADLRDFVAAYVRDEVPDYQAAALLMTIWFRGLSAAETFALTEATVASGETIDLAAHLGRRVVDKHSTGGVGDKATIAVGPVLAACIMSKKIACGASALVLDVKVGEGAFMRTQDEARRLAEAMRELGQEAGMDVVCLLTDMDQPLGRAVGNALEIREAYDTLAGGGPPDVRELVVTAATHLLELSDMGLEEDVARERVTTALDDGTALEAYE